MRILKFIFSIIFALALSSPGVARADCLGPAGAAGELVFNANHATMQYCNGADWVGFPKTSGDNSCDDVSEWVSQASLSQSWQDIAYGAGRFVAVGTFGAMTSTDGEIWEPVPSFLDQGGAILYAGGQFVATHRNASRRVATSPDGLNWTIHEDAAPEERHWGNLAYGGGRYIALSWGPTGYMSSDDGVNWTGHTGPDRLWWGAAYGNGVFVAVSHHTTEVAVSSDGMNWDLHAFAGMDWSHWNHARSITFGNGQFVAVSSDATNRVVTSPDGINWTARTAAEQNYWSDVTYANGLYVAVAEDGADRVMISQNGIDWTPMAAAEPNEWRAVAFGGGKFVAVSQNGTNRVMTAECLSPGCTDPDMPAGRLIYNGDYRVLQWCDGASWQAAGPVNPGGPNDGCENPAEPGGSLLFNQDYCILQYCDGDTWRRIGALPEAGYAANAVTNAAPATAELLRTAALANTSDGPRMTGSMWFRVRPHVANPEVQILFENYAGRIQVLLVSNTPSEPRYELLIEGKSQSDVNHIHAWEGDLIAEDIWYHLVFSFDTTLGAGHIYLNDVAVMPSYIDVNNTGQGIDIATTHYAVYFDSSVTAFQGDMADFWFDDVYVDLSVEANRRKFIAADGKPVDLGADGSAPAGSQPLIFFSGDAASWGTNKGRGGAFTQTGTLQDVAVPGGELGVGKVCAQ